MYSNAYVWSRVLSYLEQHSPAIAIASYFDDAEVIELTESKLVIYSPSPFRKDVIVKRYIDQIREAMRDQFQTEVEVVVLDETELPQYSKNKKNRNFVEFNSQYTFDKFVVGSSNQHAFSAARAVADNPADAYNPLFIYGESGLGKTHLLYAIANQIQREHPDYNIVYIKGDQFTNELIDAVRSGKNFEFRDKYRNADLFLMDDIQFIAGKDATQEEFFHTFNSLYENKRQIVLTSDRVPGDMVRLEDRLRTRFEWGLMVDVAPPDFETRFAIVQNKAAMLGVKLPNEVTDYIAENITSNVRQIEGTLNKILAYRDLLDDQVNEETVSRAIRDMLKKSNDFAPTPCIIVGYICSYFHVDEETLRGQSRSRDVVAARQIAMYLIRRMTSMSLNDIGKEFGDRDHSTILHSLDKVESTMRSNPAFAEKVKEITTNINSKK